MYISRFFQMDKDDGTLVTVADLDFALLQQPKVLLGATGGGITEACNEMALQLNGQKVHAQDLFCGLFDNTPEFEDQLLVIDGLDEVASEEIPKAFTKILIETNRLDYRNWLVSCRSYEWRSALFDPRIRTAFGKTAIRTFPRVPGPAVPGCCRPRGLAPFPLISWSSREYCQNGTLGKL